MTERSVTSIPSLAGNEIKLPNEGDVRKENDKEYTWTKRSDGTCSIYEWIEKKQTYNYDYSADDYGVYF